MSQLSERLGRCQAEHRVYTPPCASRWLHLMPGKTLFNQAALTMSVIGLVGNSRPVHA